MNQEKIGNFIKEIRKKNNLTQKDLADKLGVTYQAVSKWENGKNIPDISLLKEISILFNVDINELLEGKISEKKNENSKNNKILMIILLIILVVVTCIFFFFINHDHNFEFKTLASNCEEFDIIGSMAYNKEKTSIYISEVNYCGTDENKVYDMISCTLYEDYNNIKKEISSCSSKENISLVDYLKNLKIGVDDYNSSCKVFTSSNLYLEINANDNNKLVTYKVPITINDNCYN